MAVTYDANLIYKFAQRLYQRANSIIAGFVVFGAAFGAYLGNLLSKSAGGNPSLYLAAGALLLGVFGWLIGSERAFALKLQAQIALCQVRIEENTRQSAGITAGIR